MALHRGDLIPHFVATALDGTHFEYSTIWQRRNLLLIVLPTANPQDSAYASEISRRKDELEEFDAACVVTSDSIPNVSAPAVVVADRWGEIYVAASGSTVSDLPSAAEVFESLRYVAHECPECQGEAR